MKRLLAALIIVLALATTAESQSGAFRTTSVLITSGQSLSAAANLVGYRVAAIVMPAAWDAAGMTFQCSNDNVTYNNMHDQGGTEVTFTLAASRHVVLLTAPLLGCNYIKARSGTAGAPVNQTANRTLILVLTRIL